MKDVEDHHRISSTSNKTKSVTACNDNLNSRTLKQNVVYVTCSKCVFNSNHDACVSKFLNDVNARTKKSQEVPISASKPIRNANQSVATPLKKTFASESTIQKSKSYFRMLYENTIKIWTLWIEKQCTVRFGNDQFAPILGYGDLVQGNTMIKRVYYVKGLNHNLFSVGQLCDADLEVAFRKSTCFVRDLQGHNLILGTRESDLYTITLQDLSSPTPICLFAKASPTQAWLWHQRLSHLNFDIINLLSKNDIVESINGLAPQRLKTSDHNRSELRIQDYSNEPSSSKLVPNVSPSLDINALSLQELEFISSPLFEEYFTASNQIVSKSSALSDNSKQQDTQPTKNIQPITELTTPTINFNA
ncbi:retrovirus-related pol polyprotein from transposon TNT 1-94 [Tanacetum coccineum]